MNFMLRLSKAIASLQVEHKINKQTTLKIHEKIRLFLYQKRCVYIRYELFHVLVLLYVWFKIRFFVETL